MMPRDEPLAWRGERTRIRVFTEAHAPPVLNQWYTVCDLKGGVTVYSADLLQTCAPPVNQNIQVQAVINGSTFNQTTLWVASGVLRPVCINGVSFGLFLLNNTLDGNYCGFVFYPLMSPVPAIMGYYGIPLECDTFMLRYRHTSVGGAQTVRLNCSVTTVI